MSADGVNGEYRYKENDYAIALKSEAVPSSKSAKCNNESPTPFMIMMRPRHEKNASDFFGRTGMSGSNSIAFNKSSPFIPFPKG